MLLPLGSVDLYDEDAGEAGDAIPLHRILLRLARLAVVLLLVLQHLRLDKVPQHVL